MQNQVFKLNSCRICKNGDLQKILSLGKTPPANSFLPKKKLKEKEDYFPLALNICPLCRQLQLSHVVHPDLLFRNYVYVSSTSPVFVKHFEDYAKSVWGKLKLKKGDLVIDIGSNDGILLKPFKKLGAKVLGVDPAVKIAAHATKQGIETLPEYFNRDLADKIVKNYGHAKVITANNVFAHINDIDEVVLAVKKVLGDDGVFITESPYLMVFLQNNLFDTIYHEHLSYYSVKPLTIFFKRHGMKVFDVEETKSHGGSIRVFAAREKSLHKISNSVARLLKKETELGLDDLKTYRSFAQRIKKNKMQLKKLLKGLKKGGSKIAGFGAPAKGNTLLNYFKIGTETLDYIVEDSIPKQGLFTPGMHIPVVSPAKLNKNRPDYIFILAWNFAEPIMARLESYKKKGGRFIIPVPNPRVY